MVIQLACLRPYSRPDYTAVMEMGRRRLAFVVVVVAAIVYGAASSGEMSDWSDVDTDAVTVVTLVMMLLWFNQSAAFDCRQLGGVVPRCPEEALLIGLSLCVRVTFERTCVVDRYCPVSW